MFHSLHQHHSQISHAAVADVLQNDSLFLGLLPDDSMEGVGHDAAVVAAAGVWLGQARSVGEDSLVCDQTLASALLGGGCGVDVVEESLEIIAGKGAVHLLAGPYHQAGRHPPEG